MKLRTDSGRAWQNAPSSAMFMALAMTAGQFGFAVLGIIQPLGELYTEAASFTGSVINSTGFLATPTMLPPLAFMEISVCASANFHLQRVIIPAGRNVASGGVPILTLVRIRKRQSLGFEAPLTSSILCERILVRSELEHTRTGIPARSRLSQNAKRPGECPASSCLSNISPLSRLPALRRNISVDRRAGHCGCHVCRLA